MVALLGLGHQIYSHIFTRIQVQNTPMNLKKTDLMLNHTFGVIWNFKTKGQPPEPINKAQPQNIKNKYNLMRIELHYTIKSQPK
jgi:hypothetical protein